MSPTLWIGVAATVALILTWPFVLALSQRAVQVSTPQLLYAGRLCLARYPDELRWYDAQLAIAGFYRRVIHDENNLTRVEYVAMDL